VGADLPLVDYWPIVVLAIVFTTAWHWFHKLISSRYNFLSWIHFNIILKSLSWFPGSNLLGIRLSQGAYEQGHQTK
jgi:hypothetical protein